MKTNEKLNKKRSTFLVFNFVKFFLMRAIAGLTFSTQNRVSSIESYQSKQLHKKFSGYKKFSE